MLICCYNSYSSNPVCPGNTAPQPSSGDYVPCDWQQPNQCREGFICVHAANDPDINICCSRNSINRLVCANQQSLYTDGGRPKYCSMLQQNPCPAGFACQESIGMPGIFVCCSVPSYTTCPSGFTPSLTYTGNTIHCSPTDINVCPAEAQCMQAQNRAGTSLCCRSTESPKVCPNNQHALLKQNQMVETCTSPGAQCSNTAYNCQFSTILSTYVCCGQPVMTALCADGRETYVQEFGTSFKENSIDLGKTFSCNPLIFPSGCPNGYECTYSNMKNVNVCCRRDSPLPPQTPTNVGVAPPLPTPPPPPPPGGTFRPPVEELTCPLGWSAYQDSRGAHHFCQDALDMTCPQGFSCAQSSVTGIFMCCRLASNIQCPRAYSALLVNNSPRLCSIRSSTACPSGYLCLQSSVPAVYVCCSAASKSDLTCQDGQIPAYLGQYVRYCSVVGQIETCPPTYICSPSNRPGLNVCCHNLPIQTPQLRLHRQEATRICGDVGIVAKHLNNEPLECTDNNFYCQPSLTNTRMYCCQDARCPTEFQQIAQFAPPDYTTQLPSFSSHQRCFVEDGDDGTISECQNFGEKCVESENIKGIKICCSITLTEKPQSQIIPPIVDPDINIPLIPMETNRARCLGRKTYLIDSSSISCRDNDDCPTDYDCSSHTTGREQICCQKPEHFDHDCPGIRFVSLYIFICIEECHGWATRMNTSIATMIQTLVHWAMNVQRLPRMVVKFVVL